MTTLTFEKSLYSRSSITLPDGEAFALPPYVNHVGDGAYMVRCGEKPVRFSRYKLGEVAAIHQAVKYALAKFTEGFVPYLRSDASIKDGGKYINVSVNYPDAIRGVSVGILTYVGKKSHPGIQHLTQIALREAQSQREEAIAAYRLELIRRVTESLTFLEQHYDVTPKKKCTKIDDTNITRRQNLYSTAQITFPDGKVFSLPRGLRKQAGVYLTYNSSDGEHRTKLNNRGIINMVYRAMVGYHRAIMDTPNEVKWIGNVGYIKDKVGGRYNTDSLYIMSVSIPDLKKGYRCRVFKCINRVNSPDFKQRCDEVKVKLLELRNKRHKEYVSWFITKLEMDIAFLEKTYPKDTLGDRYADK